MGKTFMPLQKTEEELLNFQLEGLKWTVNHVFKGSPFFRKKFQDAGVTPGEIKTLGDLRRLPFTTAGDLRDGYPFPLLSVPIEDIVRIHASSGTTGKRKVLSYTPKDIDDWADMFARCYEMIGLTTSDRVLNANAYGLWTAGVGFQIGCERFGALLVPHGVGNKDLLFELMIDFEATVLMCTASAALLMAEEVGKRGIKDKIKLKKLIFGSERSSDAMRAKIKEGLGIEDLFDLTGMTELYGPGAGIDCPQHQGIHYWADYYIAEFIDPVTLEPVPEGEIGELVVTTLRKEASPLVRYRTRDLTRAIPGRCACGSLMPRHDRFLGRSDDMFIFRAVNIYPGMLDNVLSDISGIGSEYQVHLRRAEDGRDYMTIKLERALNAPAEKDAESKKLIEGLVKKRILASADVEILAYGELPRSERKTKRVFDTRD